MVNNAFIYLFECSTGFYLYDVNTDLILKINEDTYKVLKSNGKLQGNKQIEKLQMIGCLKDSYVQVSEHPMTPFLASFYKTKLDSLTLQVTQSCNLRCEYCVYSGKYTTRTHSNKRMSYDMAKQGIDFLITHSIDSNKLSFAFYGGEPLLEFDLIKKCVKYIEQQVPERKVEYLMTTNATLLDQEKTEFLIEHNFYITISLDGPKKIHDKHRRFAIDGKGTYDVVMKNVRYIKDTNYDYFKTNVNFNTVLNPEDGYECIGNYIKGNDVLNDAIFTSAIVSDIGLKEQENDISNEFLEEYRYEYFKLLLSKIGKYKESNVSCIVRKEFSRLLMMRGGRHQNGSGELPERGHHAGPCIPGQRTLFLNAEGKLYPCEKVCEMADIAVMGDVWNGIDVEKANRILNIERDTGTECRKCWAYRYCNFCIRFAEPKSGSLKENMLQRCSQMRKIVEETFKDYCVLREIGYDFEINCVKERRGGK